MCCAMLRCIALHCTVIHCTMCLCHVVPTRTVSRFVIIIRTLKCTASNYVNKLKNVFYKITCNGPCDSRLDGAVNVIAL